MTKSYCNDTFYFVDDIALNKISFPKSSSSEDTVGTALDLRQVALRSIEDTATWSQNRWPTEPQLQGVLGFGGSQLNHIRRFIPIQRDLPKVHNLPRGRSTQ